MPIVITNDENECEIHIIYNNKSMPVQVIYEYISTNA